METAQYVLQLDRVFSIDDVLLNTVGAGLAALASRPWGHGQPAGGAQRLAHPVLLVAELVGDVPRGEPGLVQQGGETRLCPRRCRSTRTGPDAVGRRVRHRPRRRGCVAPALRRRARHRSRRPPRRRPMSLPAPGTGMSCGRHPASPAARATHHRARRGRRGRAGELPPACS
ncbi:VanZ family protein [Segeticoccus rhizosphaerae]|uniref:VanZ family protein n=1 Tax=Segeticoccus rhizosphaerae TaxID=1104777 RepID=UPI003B848CE0